MAKSKSTAPTEAQSVKCDTAAVAAHLAEIIGDLEVEACCIGVVCKALDDDAEIEAVLQRSHNVIENICDRIDAIARQVKQLAPAEALEVANA